MTDLLKRFLHYARYEVTSNDKTGTHPSTPGQFVFARMLEKEMRSIGLEKVRLTEKCYLYGELPPSPGWETCPALGFIAHIDTSDGASGKNISPRVIEKYDLSVIPLGTSGKVLDPAVHTALRGMKDKTLIVTDGTTLLGADDHAGIAIILTGAEELIREKIPHGKLCFAFTPDEEIGEGTDFFDLQEFGADYAYTFDGGAMNLVEFENFNAAEAKLTFHGIAAHPGGAKNVMINALKMAMEFHSLLPGKEIPEETGGYEGFFHLHELTGTASQAEARYLIRDHDGGRFQQKKERMQAITEQFNRERPGSVTLEIREQYRNMAEVVGKYPFLIAEAENAIRQAGLEPVHAPIRGGTDGAMLSWKGLPCPNLGTGGRNAHGEYEFAVLEEMLMGVKILKTLAATRFPGRGHA